MIRQLVLELDERLHQVNRVISDFMKSLKDLIKQTTVTSLIKGINCSEHGMQGHDYVNLDVSVRALKPEATK